MIQNVQKRPFRESCLQLLCIVSLHQLILTFSPQYCVSHLRKNIHLSVVTQLGDILGQGGSGGEGDFSWVLTTQLTYETAPHLQSALTFLFLPSLAQHRAPACNKRSMFYVNHFPVESLVIIVDSSKERNPWHLAAKTVNENVIK